jgi:N-acyl-phosphatidylethanolamine-hydrolysing phospholipase D
MARPSARWSAAALLLALAASTLSGCAVLRAAGRASASLIDSPRKVTKLKDPIDKEARLAVLWIGHASALVQIDDKVILTDPVFTSTVGQLSKRLVEPGLDPENLPPVDAVVISHMHFDHLSLGSLDLIERKVRMLLMPPGGVTYLTDFSFPVLELRPWQAYEKDGLRVTAVPVDHVGYRYGIDDAWMKQSFTGYVVEYHGIAVYFGGDTSYDQKLFVDVAQRFPNIQLALLPIGPIEPRELMRRFHVDPREAVQAFIDLNAKSMVPIHYDTFINSTDEAGDALRELSAAQKRWDLGSRKVVPLAIGERRVFLKKGEEPTPLPPPKVPGDTTATTTTPAKSSAAKAAAAHAEDALDDAAPKPKPAEKPKKKPKDEIPDDEKLD